MNVGEPCPLYRNWIILAIRDDCPEHGCQRFDLRDPNKKHPRRKLCPQCVRRRTNQQARQRKLREGHIYRRNPVTNDDMEWLGDPAGFWWKAEYDRNIDRFWAKRGMTDEMARIKFGNKKVSRAEWIAHWRRKRNEHRRTDCHA